MKHCLCIPSVFAIVLLFSSVCGAQDTASLTGTIRDKSGAVHYDKKLCDRRGA